MDALDVEMRIAAGAPGAPGVEPVCQGAGGQACSTPSRARSLHAAAAHWAGGDETLLRPARDRRWRTGHPAGRRAMPPRQTPLGGRADVSIVGTFKGARPCSRTPGEPGSCPLDAPVNRPERCDADVLPAWMPGFAVEHPVQDSAGWSAQRLALEVAASVRMEGRRRRLRRRALSPTARAPGGPCRRVPRRAC